MKGKSTLMMFLGVGLVLTGGSIALAVDQISHNLIDGSGDTAYDALTGVLTVNSTAPYITVYDPGDLGLTITSASISLSTNFSSYDSNTHEAIFTGGYLDLTFSDNANNDYQIAGPVDAMLFTIAAQSTISYIYGQGNWDAQTVDLPGTGTWPDDDGLSSMTSLTLAIGMDLGAFNWTQGLSGNIETLYDLWPEPVAVPEPLSVLLLGLGSVALVRRRR